MKVKYTGTADFQEFSAADFKKADIEGKKVSFARNEPTEVSDEVGQALVASDGVFGGHSFEEVNEDGEDDEEASHPAEGGAQAADSASASADGSTMTKSGSASTSDAGTTTGARTGGARRNRGATGTTGARGTTAGSTT